MPAVPSCLADPLWDQFRALVPRSDNTFDPAHPLGCHRRRIPHRIIFDKLLAALVFGCSYVMQHRPLHPRRIGREIEREHGDGCHAEDHDRAPRGEPDDGAPR